MEALILVALFPVILCNPLAEVGGREAAETKALYAKVDRMLDAGSAFNVVHSDTTLYLSRGWTGTYDEAKSKCESYNGVLASLTTERNCSCGCSRRRTSLYQRKESQQRVEMGNGTTYPA